MGLKITVAIDGGKDSDEVIDVIEVSSDDMKNREWPYIANQVREACTRGTPRVFPELNED